MIKVLMVSTVGLGVYGITNSIMNYYREIDKTDMQIDFLTTNEVPKKLRVEIKRNDGKVYQKIRRNRNIPGYMLRLAGIIKRGHYDIVHVHGNSSTLAIELFVAKLCKVKVRIAHCHNSTCDHMLLHKLLKHVFDRCYTHAFACSEKAGRWLYGEKTFTIINNGIPVEKFLFNKTERDRIRKKLNCEKNKVIGHVGHFSYQKNQEFLIKIFTEIYKKDNSYRLLLVGDGDFRDKIEEAAVKNGVKDAVIFYGETFNVSKPLQAMDIFVFPSRFEGLGMAVIEAQAAGLPCIVTDAVPNIAKITKQMEYVSLEEPLDTWVNKILNAVKLDREGCFEQNKEQIENSIYNIKKEACKLKTLYYRYLLEK